jgi:uncharacterized protein YcbK (DUF882 family)
MVGSRLPLRAACLVGLGLVLAPAVASAANPTAKKSRTARIVKANACLKPPVEVVAGKEAATFSLAQCNGSAAALGVDQLSILARPASAPKPKESLTSLGKTRSANLAPGIRRIDARLVERLELVVDHFRKEGQPARVALVSGYRPRSARSYHATGRAIDFRVEGITNEALVAFCKTLPDTGCGYYPNSLFVHMDVRDAGSGHVSWIDASRPGEAPHYVTAWPPPADAPASQDDSSKLPPLPADEHESIDGPGPAKERKGGEALRFY